MFSRRDRFDLACFGLMVLAFGLVGAPLVHLALHHAGGARHALAHLGTLRPLSGNDAAPHAPHDHGDPTHGAWSIEHLDAVVILPDTLPPPQFVAIATLTSVPLRPRRPEQRTTHSPEQPQAP